GPSVIINGPAGQTARIVLVKGFIQPVTLEPFINGTPSEQAFAPTLQAQLDALAAEDFPANNAVEFQTVDVVLTGANQDISDQFNFTSVPRFDFDGEDTLPLGFVASAIDPTNDDLPIGPVTEPIYLQFEDEPAAAQNEVSILTLQDATEPSSNGQFAVSLSEAAATDTTVAYNISGTATPGADYTALSGTVTIPAGQTLATLDVEVLDDAAVEVSESVIVTLAAVTAGDANIAIGTENTATVEIGDDELPSAMPIASIAAVQDASEPDGDGQFVVSLSEAASSDTVLAYSVTGTAIAGVDYTTLPGTVTIPAGELSATIEVAVLDDQLEEAEESVTVTIDAITAGDGDVVLGASNAATVAITDDDTVQNPNPGDGTVLFRVNAGGPQIAAADGGPAWLADTQGSNSDFLLNPDNNIRVGEFPAIEPGPTVSPSVPGAIFDTERSDRRRRGSNLQYGFGGLENGDYEVRLYFGNGFSGTSAPGQRIFDVALEGNIPTSLDNIDLSAQFGHQVGGVISNVVEVTDGTLNIEFFHGAANNPLVNGIEILQVG
ncbi:MAG: Calx-beta domain-containing protein, partial [Cyanobacteria bacterium J06641_5]